MVRPASRASIDLEDGGSAGRKCPQRLFEPKVRTILGDDRIDVRHDGIPVVERTAPPPTDLVHDPDEPLEVLEVGLATRAGSDPLRARLEHDPPCLADG